MVLGDGWVRSWVWRGMRQGVADSRCGQVGRWAGGQVGGSGLEVRHMLYGRCCAVDAVRWVMGSVTGGEGHVFGCGGRGGKGGNDGGAGNGNGSSFGCGREMAILMVLLMPVVQALMVMLVLVELWVWMILVLVVLAAGGWPLWGG